MALLLSGPFVEGHGITGASWMYAIIMTVLALALFIAVVIRLRKERIWLSGERVLE
jgi:hypothetical protein